MRPGGRTHSLELILQGEIADWLRAFTQRDTGERRDIVVEVYPRLLGRASVLLEQTARLLQQQAAAQHTEEINSPSTAPRQ